MRTFVSIPTLLLAAVAGAQPAPPAAPAAAPSAQLAPPSEHAERIVELRDPSGRRFSCSCRYRGNYLSADCSFCVERSADTAPTAAADSQLTVRVTERGAHLESRPFWVDVTERLRGNPHVRSLVADLEIRLDESGLELAITCRATPEDRVYVPVGAGVYHRPGFLADLVGGRAAYACSKRPTRTELAPRTTWAGCPTETWDLEGYNRGAIRKIEIAALVRSHRDEWAALRRALVFDDLIYHCAKELHVDPVSASGMGNKATFRANVTLVCTNDPQRRGELNAGEAGMDVETFRRHVGTELRRICGIGASTASSGTK